MIIFGISDAVRKIYSRKDFPGLIEGVISNLKRFEKTQYYETEKFLKWKMYERICCGSGVLYDISRYRRSLRGEIIECLADAEIDLQILGLVYYDDVYEPEFRIDDHKVNRSGTVIALTASFLELQLKSDDVRLMKDTLSGLISALLGALYNQYAYLGINREEVNAVMDRKLENLLHDKNQKEESAKHSRKVGYEIESQGHMGALPKRPDCAG